jgi:thiamine kinase-like enzyme
MDPRLLALRQAVIDRPKDLEALTALARGYQQVGQAAEAAIWFRRALDRAKELGPISQALHQDAFAACLLIEQANPAKQILREICFITDPPLANQPRPPSTVAALPAWHGGRDPTPAALVFYDPGTLCDEQALLGLGAAVSLRDAGCQIFLVTGGRLAPVARRALGPKAVRGVLDPLPTTLPPATRRAALTLAPWVLACQEQSPPLAQWAQDDILPAQTGGPWLLLPPESQTQGRGLPFTHWQALGAEWTHYAPPISAWESEQGLADMMTTLANAAGVIGQNGAPLLLAAAMGKPIVLLRNPSASSQGWWWGTRARGSRWFPTLRPVDVAVQATPAQTVVAVQAACHDTADAPTQQPYVQLDTSALGKGWRDWVDDTLDRAVPYLSGGPGPYRLKELTDGTHNVLLHVDGPQGEHVVRTADWPVTPPTFYQREFTNMQRAAAHGLAPNLLHGDDLDGLIVLPYLPGPFLRNRDIRDEETAALVARHYLALHHLDGFVGAYDVFRRARDRHRSLKNTDNAFYDAQASRHALMSEVAEILTKAMPPPCACHNDAIPENLARHGQGLIFIDWQISGMGDPHWDLGSFVGQITMTEAQKDPFYAAYYGHANHPARSRAALYEAYCVYYNLLRAIDDGRRKPDKSGWKRRHARWSAFMDQIDAAGHLPGHIKRAQESEAIAPVPPLATRIDT